MYTYSLSGYEDITVLTNEKKFTKKQFEIMCKEAPLYNCGMGDSYDMDLIMKYLIKTYDFKKLKYTAGFFVDLDLD
jgi:hypothetical protein